MGVAAGAARCSRGEEGEAGAAVQDHQGNLDLILKNREKKGMAALPGMAVHGLRHADIALAYSPS